MPKKIILFAVFLIVALFCVTSVSAMTDSERAALIAQIQEQLAQLNKQVLEYTKNSGGSDAPSDAASTEAPPTFSHTFTKNLGFADSGNPEVGYLHDALDALGISYAPDTENIYGEGTARAIKEFQEKYASEILAPLGLSAGTGYTGKATIAKLNELSDSSSVATLSGGQVVGAGHVPGTACAQSQYERSYCTDSNEYVRCQCTEWAARAGTNGTISECTNIAWVANSCPNGLLCETRENNLVWCVSSGNSDSSSSSSGSSSGSSSSSSSGSSSGSGFNLCASCSCPANKECWAHYQWGYSICVTAGDYSSQGYEKCTSASSVGTSAVCGNGILESPEQCDGDAATCINGEGGTCVNCKCEYSGGSSDTGEIEPPSSEDFATGSKCCTTAGGWQGTQSYVRYSGETYLNTVGQCNACNIGTICNQYSMSALDTVAVCQEPPDSQKCSVGQKACCVTADGQSGIMNCSSYGTWGLCQQCQAGQTCSSGACTSSSSSGQQQANVCIDSDGGKTYNTKGTVTDKNGTWQDYCSSSYYLVENYCSSSQLASETHYCGYGCDAGVCRQTQQAIITVTSPNGGETWKTGETRNITWTYSGAIDTVNITAVGSSSTLQIAANFPVQNMSYNWTIPSYFTSGSYKIAVISASNSSVTDQSNSYFNIAPSSTTTSQQEQQPTCSDTDNGQVYGVKGTASNSSAVSVADSCSDANNLTESYCGADGNVLTVNYWCVEGCENGACKEPTVITITSPNTAVTWYTGETHNITWASSGIANVNISLVQAVTGLSYNVASSVPASNGSYSWTISSIPVQDYKMVITSSAQSWVSDQSDAYFKIRSGSSSGTTCTDSDGGMTDYYTKGTVTNTDGTWEDYCDITGDLVEMYCGGSNDAYTSYTEYFCSNGCSQGACQQSHP